MRNAVRVSALVLLALVATDAWAAVLYKLTDRDGAVTYSDSVPRGYDGRVERLDIDTREHTVNLSQIAGGREESASQAYERIIRQRPEPSGQEIRVEAAQQRLESARAALEDARNNSTPQDWIYLGPNNPRGMKRAPRPEYLDRLQRLEQQVQIAEEELRAAERGA